MAGIKDPVLFSQRFEIDPDILAEEGLVDPFLTVDTQLFIDPVLLEKSDHPLIRGDALRPVEIQDSTFGLVVIQAADGTIRIDGRPMGEDRTALFGQAHRPWTKRERQPALCRSGALDRADG
jgi:hypothetical protein